MIEITAEIRALIDKAAAGVELAGDEYIDPADGLIHCKKCGGHRQTVVPCFGKPGYFMPRCICQCQRGMCLRPGPPALWSLDARSAPASSCSS